MQTEHGRHPTARIWRGAASVVLAVGLAALLMASLARAAWLPPLRAPLGRGLVAADNLEAARAGAAVLAQGGNAVDAAVATALALGVAMPAGSGLGGGGFAVVWDAKTHHAAALDFRETAPAAATRDMFLVDGKADPNRSRFGGLSVGVPGEPAGLAELAAKHGKLGLAAAAAPAIRLADEGYTVSHALTVGARLMLERLRPDDPLRGLVTPLSTAEGERRRSPDLAATLRQFAARGRDGFYRGDVGHAIVDTVRRAGGVVTQADLDGYRPLWQEPLVGHYRGRTLYGAPPPAGGATTLETLHILDARPPLAPLGAGSSAAYHQIAEALKHAFADRARVLGNPAFAPVPTAHLIDPAYARERAATIGEKTLRPADYGDAKLAGTAPVAPPRDHGTSHLCVVDGEGNMVALTTTINLGFGSHLTAAGVPLNDEMDDFSAQPGVANAFGLVGAAANAVAAGKRPLSSMSPLIIVYGDRAVLCAGGSGGPLIVSETVQTVVNVIDFGMDAQAAVSAPRIHAQWIPDVLLADAEIPADVIDGLKRRGHNVTPPPPLLRGSAAQVIVVAADHVEGAADPRKGGQPAVPNK